MVYNAIRRESKAKFAGLLQQLVVYINRVSDGDLVKLHSSGFPVLDKKRKGQAQNTPQNPYLMDGQRSGEIAYGFKPVGRDMLYEFCFAFSVDRRGNPYGIDSKPVAVLSEHIREGLSPAHLFTSECGLETDTV